ncbi:MAG: hypothetical protein HYS75_05760 [Nitrosopumilales archaeon]|nr:hypothetical protein [Nitrosopumilales archaeon]
MQEIAILLSSLAGACTAAAVKKFPKGKHTISTLGANAHIKNQINSLKLEKEILTKTISRLYQHDQKLSTLDKRLYELSSKINLANTQTLEIKHEQQISEKRIKEIEPKLQAQTKTEIVQTKLPDPVSTKPHRPFEITTLTELPEKIPESFFKTQVIVPQVKDELARPQKEQVELVEHTSVVPQIEQPKIEQSQEQSSSPSVVKKPTPKVTLPDDEKEEEDEDDLDKIKGEIMKTLSKLEQAEVE